MSNALARPAPIRVEDYLAGLAPDIRAQVEPAWARVREAVPEGEPCILCVDLVER